MIEEEAMRPTPGEAVALTYELRVGSQEALGSVTADRCDVGRAGQSRLEVQAGARYVRIESDASDLQVWHSTEGGETIVHDPPRHFRIAPWPGSPAEEGATLAGSESTAPLPELALGDEPLPLRYGWESRLSGGARLAVWLTTEVTMPADSLATLRRALLPDVRLPPGLPALVQATETGSGRPLFELRLCQVGRCSADPPPIEKALPFEGPELAELAESVYPPPSTDPLPTPWSGLLARRNQGARRLGAEVRRRHTLRVSGQDYSWLTTQPVLDRLRGAVNALSRRLGSFEGGRRGGAHINFDWWNHVAPALHEDFREDRLTEIALTVAVATGASLPALDRFEQPAWDLLRSRTGLTEIERIAGFRDLMADSGRRLGTTRLARTAAIAAAVFEPIKQTQILDLGLEPERGSFDDWWDYRFDDYRVDVDLAHQPLIQALEFRDERIRLVVGVEMFRLRLRYQLTRGTNWRRFLLHLATAGASVGPLFGRRGVVSGRLDNASLAFDITAEPLAGAFRLRATPNPDESSIDWRYFVIDAGVGGPLPFHSPGPIFQSFFGDLVEAKILETLTDTLEGLLLPAAVSWPRIWNVDCAPAAVGSAVLFDSPESGNPGSGVFEGESGLLTGVARPLDARLAAPTAVAFSPEYLTSWLRQCLSNPPGSQILPAALFTTPLGASLPAAEGFEDPDFDPGELTGTRLDASDLVECGPPPSLPAPSYRNLVDLRRLGPDLRLDADGQTSRAAQIAMGYSLTLRAVRSWSTPRAIVRRDCIGGEPGSFRDGSWPFAGPWPFDSAAPDLQRSLGGLRAGLRVGRNFADWDRRVGGGAGGGGLVTGPGGPDSRPRPGDRSGGGRICSETCEWVLDEHEVGLRIYLAAEVEVLVDLLVDFDPDQVNFLQQLRLRVATDDSGGPALTVRSRLRRDEGTFDGISDRAIEQIVSNLAVADASALLAPIVRTDDLTLEKTLFPPVWAEGPMFLGFRRAVHSLRRMSNLLVFGQPEGTARPIYEVLDGMLYWPLDFSLDTGLFFRSAGDP